MDYVKKIIGEIEVHSVEGIKECFENGVSPNDRFQDQPLIHELTSEYTRSPRFKDCVKAFVEHGLTFDDKALLAVLMDDASALRNLLDDNRGIGKKAYSLHCAYTPLHQVSLLPICA